MELAQLSAAWPIPGPWSMREQGGGINNFTRFVDTPAGPYILKVYSQTRDQAKVRYEIALIMELSRMGLSFAVPVPVPTRSGDRLAVTPEGALATLVPLIPGTTPGLDRLERPYPVGAALGELTAALGRATVQPPPGHLTYGDVEALLGTDPLSLPAQAPTTPDGRAGLERLTREVLEQIPTAYASLPRSTIHGDFVLFNLLMVDHRVTGVLDFENAGCDLRAMDFASAVAMCPGGVTAPGAEWRSLEQMCRGFFSRQALTPAEIAALPFLMRLRKAVTILHMLCLYRDGMIPLPVIQKACDKALVLEHWLGANARGLVARLGEWQRLTSSPAAPSAGSAASSPHEWPPGTLRTPQ